MKPGLAAISRNTFEHTASGLRFLIEFLQDSFDETHKSSFSDGSDWTIGHEAVHTTAFKKEYRTQNTEYRIQNRSR
jgi:hypothetical protein